MDLKIIKKLMSFIKKLILFIYLCNENMLNVKVEKEV